MALKLIKTPGEIKKLTDENLDNVTAQGVYHQSMIVNANTDRGYPEKNAGLLEVHNPDARMVYQRYTCFWSGAMYYRGRYDKKWGEWTRIATQ